MGTAGTKIRHASGEDTAPTLTTRYAECDFYDQGGASYRHANTLSRGEELAQPGGQRFLPTVFKWEGGGKDVYVTGSFNNWKSKIPMVRSQGEFLTIIELPIGEHQYKFYVDGQWMNSPIDPVTSSDIGTQNNVIKVKRTDFDAFEALAIDGKACEKNKEEAKYGQEIPPRDTSDVKYSAPPLLPAQLLKADLNKNMPVNVEPSLLPEPNQCMLNHMYALSIKDGVMVLSATHRFRRKYVTTLLYKPIK